MDYILSYFTQKSPYKANTYSREIVTPSPYTPKEKFVDPLENEEEKVPTRDYLNTHSRKRDYSMMTYIAHQHMSEANTYLLHLASKTPSFVLSRYTIKVEKNRIFYSDLEKGIFQDIIIEEEEDNVIDYWKTLMKKSSIKLIFIFTITTTIKGGKHANWTIVDKPRKVVEFFDPHGHYNIESRYPMWEADWAKVFKDKYQCTKSMTPTCFIPRKYTILRYKDSCPLYGFQYYESIYGGPTLSYDREGYCTMWCLFLLEFRLANKEMGTKEVQEYLLMGLGSEEFTREVLGEKFREYIRYYNSLLLDKIPEDWDMEGIELMNPDSPTYRSQFE